MRIFLAIILCIWPGLLLADTLVAVKTIRANTILTPQDIALDPNLGEVGLDDPSALIGMETRVVLYAGRPILAEHVGPPAVVNRNQIVPLVFRKSGLSISTAGRALDRGAEGDIIRVMNMSSRTTLFGTVLEDGSVDVSGF
jgi:flagella basal body P-ring formation protein FlgA